MVITFRNGSGAIITHQPSFERRLCPHHLPTPNSRFEAQAKEDESQILTLLPYLADFDIPIRRSSADLWSGRRGSCQDHFVRQCALFLHRCCRARRRHSGGPHYGESSRGATQPCPSAHLEAIVVAPKARGTGLGKRLMLHCERKVRQQGASSLTLHVFSHNARARALYASEGFDEELVRAIKWLD